MSQRRNSLLSRPFTYIPLEKGGRQVRLLRFEVGEAAKQDEIHLSISTHDLSNLPSYFALSYVWGTDVPRHELYICGKVLMARDSLWLALSQLRTHQPDHEVHHFWIDAICINQDDLAERAHQVNLMGEIYSNARFVVSWLGPGTTALRGAIEAVGKYETARERSGKSDVLALNRRHIAPLLKVSYFERMWIVQEFVLARKVFMVCGGGDCFWWDNGMAGIVKEMLTTWNDGVDGFDVVVWLASERLHRQEKRSTTELDRLLVYFRRQKCADLRDRVYALIGLLDRTGPRSWIADYTISREHLWCRVIDGRMSDDKATRVLFSYTASRLWEALELPLEDGSLELSRFVLWVIHFDEIWNARDQMPVKMKQSHEENLKSGLDALAMFNNIIPHFDRFPLLLEAAAWQKFTERLREIMAFEVEHNAQRTPGETSSCHGLSGLQQQNGHVRAQNRRLD
ncbi:hypothetical protein ASPVEDRAFT_35857 [Aspergillus versicolor CBS 583.65]|uniref:Heterokaryon incompatibility domain-containing protein n=1 Tax=Aspergillus versicolor CBS 583.65 TaxID=1036611 RepID=A0A1L9P4K8_ASPVE|nr:uncharacterized protein ASPVEDRAFT_35857 [Aspergillus versicolor CBS 583.65]OJI96460.1 hypothetical protein ASPVEDRAFT_35857 [Aspergillus versicolor CBS 583.65]